MPFEPEPFPPLPVPPGESPFHLKGIVIQGFFAYADAKIPGGRQAVLARIPDERVRKFYDQPMLAASWFDVLPFLHVLGAGSVVAGLPTPRFLMEHGAWQAERDVRGVHRVLLMVSSPEMVARRIGVAFSQYFDFATVSVDNVDTGVMELTVDHLPRILTGWYRYSVMSAGERILQLAGARQQQVELTTPEPAGMKSGLPLVRFKLRRTWTR